MGYLGLKFILISSLPSVVILLPGSSITTRGSYIKKLNNYFVSRYRSSESNAMQLTTITNQLSI